MVNNHFKYLHFLINFFIKKAANGGHLGIVKLLLEHCADKTIEKNHNGYSAYTYGRLKSKL
jgi:hypothetical protein